MTPEYESFCLNRWTGIENAMRHACLTAAKGKNFSGLCQFARLCSRRIWSTPILLSHRWSFSAPIIKRVSPSLRSQLFHRLQREQHIAWNDIAFDDFRETIPVF